MRTRLLHSLLLLQLLLLAAPPTRCQRIQLTLVEPPKRDQLMFVNCMLQDSMGFMWMGTSNGLYKYDGFQYWAYHSELYNSNSPSASDIDNVALDKDGAIWMTARNNGLDKLDPVTGKFTHYRHDPKNTNSLGNDTCWHILFDHTGLLWICSNNGVDTYDTASHQFTHYLPNPDDSTALSHTVQRTIYEDKQGNIWLAAGGTFAADVPHAPGGLCKFNRATKTFTRYLHDDNDSSSLADNRVSALFEDSKGNFWVGTAGDGLHIMDRATGRFRHYYYDSTHPEKLSRPAVRPAFNWGVDHITFIAEDAGGKIWIGTLMNGMNVYDPVTGIATHYGGTDADKDKLYDPAFWLAFLARDKQLWISSWHPRLYKTGGTQLPVQHITTGTSNIGIAEDDQHELWLASQNGLVHMKNDGTKEMIFNPASPIRTKEAIQCANTMFAIVKDGPSFWIRSVNGIYQFNLATKTFRLQTDANNKTWNADTTGMLSKGAGDVLWISTGHGLDKLHSTTGLVTTFANDPADTQSLSNNKVFFCNIDKEHRLWVATERGLNLMTDSSGKFRRYLPNVTVISTMQDQQGVIWANTSIGLFRYNKNSDTFSQFSDDTGLPGTSFTVWTVEDRKQHLWTVSPSLGVLETNTSRNMMTVFGKGQGLVPQALYGFAFARANGDIIVPDSTGYYQFIHGRSVTALETPVISIYRLLLNNQPVLPSKDGIISQPLDQTSLLRLQHTQNTFSFEFSMIDYHGDQSEARILYKLENFDNAWRPAPDARNAYYFNLAPGHYVFKVKGINNLGVSAEKSIAIDILPPWWKTWWATALLVLVLAALALFLYRNRVNKINRDQKTQIAIMVAAQEGERKRIALDLHDGVGTKLSALKLFISSLQERSVNSGHPEIATLAQNSGQFITEVMQDVRQLLLNLSPVLLEEFGYMAAVEALIYRINETKQIHFELVTYGIKERLPRDYELALFRITQELISNVLKHAGAKHVNIQIGCRDQKIILMVDDDGSGFDVHAASEGLGLNNLGARTKLMNGSMVVDSQPGRGTSVSIEIPYQPDAT